MSRDDVLIFSGLTAESGSGERQVGVFCIYGTSADAMDSLLLLIALRTRPHTDGKTTEFWDVTSCSQVNTCRRFECT